MKNSIIALSVCLYGASLFSAVHPTAQPGSTTIVTNTAVKVIGPTVGELTLRTDKQIVERNGEVSTIQLTAPKTLPLTSQDGSIYTGSLTHGAKAFFPELTTDRADFTVDLKGETLLVNKELPITLTVKGGGIYSGSASKVFAPKTK